MTLTTIKITNATTAKHLETGIVTTKEILGALSASEFY